MKKTLYILFFVITLLFSVNKVFAYDYTIENYDVNIIVNENNVLDITENINVDFNTYKHGIFRKIPINNRVARQDGTTETNHAKISNINVSENYTSKYSGGYKVIRIGSERETIIGEHDYSISYSYDLGKDRNKNYDELYFNIIGTEWDTTIGNVTFSIEMPKDFDSSKLGFSVGRYGSSGYKEKLLSLYEISGNKITGIYSQTPYTYDQKLLLFEVKGNKITGMLGQSLGAYEGLTVRLELDEGYFDVKDRVDFFTILMFVIPLIGVFVAIYLWNRYGKDDTVIETVEFYPPEGLNSLEIAYLYKGHADSKDVVSLLIYLANNGYLRIDEIKKKGAVSKSKTFKFVKLKDYDGDRELERMFFDELFSYGRKVDGKKTVTEKDLKNRFYKVINRVLSKINTPKNHKKIFEDTSKKTLCVVGLIIISLLIILLKPLYEYFGTISFNILYMVQALLYNKVCLIGFLIGIACVVIMIICTVFMKKRNRYGNEILGKIKGFKNFLETAEKDKLEAMVKDDPEYFYKILPYTYVLNVSDKWIKKFESIAIEPPTWYGSNDVFDYVYFSSFVSRTMTSATSAMTSMPSSSSSGSGSSGGSGFSGGGFSGGGSGGGGGGSW